MAERICKLLEGGTSEVIVKKSRFLGITFPVETAEEAALQIAGIRKKYYDARHNCYAYRLTDKERFSDDGEPSQTAGKPMLDVLAGAGLTGALVVVTRYFGGTLLGTGGLVRAYTDAAKEAVAKALGVGFSCFGPAQVEILHDENGRPVCRLYDGALARLTEIGGHEVLVSITHDGGLAAAFAVAQ